MDPEKCKKVFDIMVPSNRSALWSILGLVIVLCKFFQELVSGSSGVWELEGKNAPWMGTDTHTRAHKKIQELVNSQHNFKPWYNFLEELKYLVYDASFIGLGLWIAQGELGSIWPYRFHYRKFSSIKLKYQTSQKEFLAIVDSLMIFEDIVMEDRLLYWS